MMDCKPRATPCEAKPNAVDNSDPQPTMNYREVVSSLIYLMTCTRPDISWIVTRLSQSLENPGAAEWIMLKHVLRYLRGSLNNGLLYQKSKMGLTLVGYSDSDWASSEDRCSTTGYYYSLNPAGPPIYVGRVENNQQLLYHLARQSIWRTFHVFKKPVSFRCCFLS